MLNYALLVRMTPGC